MNKTKPSAQEATTSSCMLPLDAWQRELLLEAAGNPATWEGEGRVLRMKFGYNPNSSSIGSVVSILMWSATFTALAINIVSAMVGDRAGARHLLRAGGAAADASSRSASVSAADEPDEAAPTHSTSGVDR